MAEYSSKDKNWHPAKGDYIRENLTEDVKVFHNQVKRQTTVILLLSFSTITFFLAAVYYFAVQ